MQSEIAWEKIIVLISLLLLISFASTAEAVIEEKTKLTIELAEEGPTHITLEITNPEKFEELKNVITEPAVVSIYQESLSPIFGDIHDLKISTKSSSIVIEFDSDIAKEEDKKLVVDRIDFNNRLSTVSELKIVSPKGYKLKETDSQSDEVTKDHILWYNVDFIPEITFAKSPSIKQMIVGLFLVLVILLAVKLKTQKTRKQDDSPRD